MMFLRNPLAVRTAYPPELHALMNIAAGRQSRTWLTSWRGLHPGPTPLRRLPGLARALRVGELMLKDESVRSPLGSFKALGAPIALVRLVLRQWPDAGWTASDLFEGKHADALGSFVAISATDGNHGRALAAAARSLGCRCVIVLHANVDQEREDAIAAFGAEIVRVAGDYDASVEEAERLARQHGWHVVSDTSYEGYEDVPRDVMQGYGVIADEVLEAIGADSQAFTHVVLQGGVGGMAAGIVSNFWERFGPQRPTFIVVEPRQADCLYQSALQGRPARTRGTVDSVMAGLACGETSPLAWRFLARSVDFFLTVEDSEAAAAMRQLAHGGRGDIPVVSGESGAASLAGLNALVNDARWRLEAGLGDTSRVLLISTEGATAPSVYQRLVGTSAATVIESQRDWLARNTAGANQGIARVQAWRP